MNTLSPELLAQIFSQESHDPFLALVTLNHVSFASPIRLVNNQVNITSRGNVYSAFPFRFTLPVDDGETLRQAVIEFDNVSLDLIDEFRSVNNTTIEVTIELILASIPDIVQMSVEELKIGRINYDSQKVVAELYVDNILQSGLTSEKYTPQNFPGLF